MTHAPAHVVIMTGAGISADSGVATFRDTDGLWEGHRPEDVATPEAWARDRAMVWRFYQARRAQILEVEPNAAHTALATFEQAVRDGGGKCTLVTQNVDNLHERAGSTGLLHMHGELAVLRCATCGHRAPDLEHLDPDSFVPCPTCSADALRPDIVWFGEMPYHLDAIESAMTRCTHFIAIGTSGVVWPAAGYLHAARAGGITTWVQALDPPANLDAKDRFFPGRAKDVAHELFAAVLATL